MFFVLGVLLFLTGAVVSAAFGGPRIMGVHFPNKADQWAGGAIIIGGFMALGSVLHFASGYLA